MSNQPRMCAIAGCSGKHHAHGYCYKHYARNWRTGDPSDRKNMNGTLRERFFRYIHKFDTGTGCIEWAGSVNKKGYGRIGADRPSRKILLAHRVSYELHIGKIPDGMFVCHKCDNPRCVNPNHLFLGTNQDNVTDMMRKGRDYRGVAKTGEAHHGAKLTTEQVMCIRKDVRSLSKIADTYHISKSQASSIKTGRSWKHT